MAQKKTISYLLLAARVLRVVEQRIHEQLDKSGGIEEQLLVLIADREVQNALTVPCFHRAHPPDWMAMVRCLQKCVCFNFCYVCPEPVLAYIQFFSLKWHTQKTFLHLHDLSISPWLNSTPTPSSSRPQTLAATFGASMRDVTPRSGMKSNGWSRR
jgi:hypothetical protein